MDAGLDKRDVDVEDIVEVKRKPTPMMPINSPGSDHTGMRSSRAINIPGDWSLVVIDRLVHPSHNGPLVGHRLTAEIETNTRPLPSAQSRLPGFGFQSASAADARTASTLTRLHAWPAVVGPLKTGVFFCRAKNAYGPSRRWRPCAVMSVAGDERTCLGHRQTVAIGPIWEVECASRQSRMIVCFQLLDHLVGDGE